MIGKIKLLLNIILKINLNFTPQMKKEFENHLSPSEYRWFAIYSRYRCEKMVYTNLIKKQIKAYLPLFTSGPKKGAKKKKVASPLIPNYVFVKITAKEYVKVLETLYVQRFVKIANNLIAIPESEIHTLKQFVENGNVRLVSTTSDFSKGDWVEITSGPLVGVKGILMDVQGKKNITVKLIALGFSLQMEIPVDLVKKIGRSELN
ncbi:MAG: transcription antitermination factor NusG [Polaribacter sp.]